MCVCVGGSTLSYLLSVVGGVVLVLVFDVEDEKCDSLGGIWQTRARECEKRARPAAVRDVIKVAKGKMRVCKKTLSMFALSRAC